MRRSRSQNNRAALTNKWVPDSIRIALARSLFVGASFAATAVVMVSLGQTPERSASAWGFVTLVLLLLSAFAGLAVTFWETRQR
jgi:hypothetical protein